MGAAIPMIAMSVATYAVTKVVTGEGRTEFGERIHSDGQIEVYGGYGGFYTTQTLSDANREAERRFPKTRESSSDSSSSSGVPEPSEPSEPSSPSYWENHPNETEPVCQFTLEPQENRVAVTAGQWTRNYALDDEVDELVGIHGASLISGAINGLVKAITFQESTPMDAIPQALQQTAEKLGHKLSQDSLDYTNELGQLIGEMVSNHVGPDLVTPINRILQGRAIVRVYQGRPGKTIDIKVHRRLNGRSREERYISYTTDGKVYQVKKVRNDVDLPRPANDNFPPRGPANPISSQARARV